MALAQDARIRFSGYVESQEQLTQTIAVLDAYMDGVMLLFHHRDLPGLIGYIGTIFGKHQVNIAQMTVGRQLPGGEAIAVLNLDSMPPDEALAEVRAHPQISSLSVVKLPPAG